jgi:hypothetical protein
MIGTPLAPGAGVVPLVGFETGPMGPSTPLGPGADAISDESGWPMIPMPG